MEPSKSVVLSRGEFRRRPSQASLTASPSSARGPPPLAQHGSRRPGRQRAGPNSQCAGASDRRERRRLRGGGAGRRCAPAQARPFSFDRPRPRARSSAGGGVTARGRAGSHHQAVGTCTRGRPSCPAPFRPPSPPPPQSSSHAFLFRSLPSPRAAARLRPARAAARSAVTSSDHAPLL